MRITSLGAALLLIANTAYAQEDLDAAVSSLTPKSEGITAAVAVGPKDGANWKVIGAIGDQISPNANVYIQPKSSSGSFISASAVCAGKAELGIVGRDAATYRRFLFDNAVPTGCSGKMAVLSNALFPYYLYAIVRADAPYSTMSRMFDHTDPAKPLQVAAGDPGSGAQVVLHNLIESHPAWRALISKTNNGGEQALHMLDSRDVDMVLVFDAHNSDFINRQVSGNVMPDGTKKFKILTVDPYSEFFNTGGATHGRHVYQTETISGGWFSSVKTISTDGIMIVNKPWWDAHKMAANYIARACDSATAAIRSATGTDPNWVPAFNQKQ